MSKKIISMLLTLVMLAALVCIQVPAAYAEEQSPTGNPGEWYTYYFLAPAKFFTTNESIGLYYWQPSENAKWPGVEVPVENCVYTYPDGCRIYKTQVWQDDAATQDEDFTTSIVLFNSYVDAEIDPANGHQTSNVNVEGYAEDEISSLKYGSNQVEFPHYQEGTEIANFNGMIYVPNMEISTENEFSGAIEIGGGVWYYYWGNGNYGVTEKMPAGSQGNNSVHDAPSVDTNTDSEPVAPAEPYSLGDVNGDGYVKMDDVVMIQKNIAKLITLDEKQSTAANVNKDANITMEDVVMIQKFIAKLISEF